MVIIGFVRNALDVAIDQALAKALDNIFGPESAEDVEY
jgi:hypothetical protein